MTNPSTNSGRRLPSGTVTFLFTDIEGSTPLYQNFPEAMPRALRRHHEILQNAIAAHHGHVFQVIGDAFYAAFEDPDDALNASIDAQRALRAEPWGEVGELRVRMGVHTGTAEVNGDDYVSSLTLARTQRIMSAGHGGQTLLSHATAESLQDHLSGDLTLRELGTYKLRGLLQTERLYQVIAVDLPSEFAPLRVVETTTDAQDSTALLEQLVRGKLIGRHAELAQLQQHWSSAQQARAHLVLLSGEPGIGKTRLALELIAHAQEEGAQILRGGCYEYEATTPYLPFVEAIRDWVHGQSKEVLHATLGATAPEIAKLAPEIEMKLGSLTPNPSLPPNEERLRFFDNVARFLQTLAAPRGLLLFFDDLHWVDQGTLNLLHYLLRHLRNDRVLILTAYREMELDRAHPLAAALVEWNRERLTTRISLARLSRQDTAILVATLFGQETISDEFVQVLYRETEGNPFFIEEVVKALIEQGQIYRENDGWGRKEIHDLAIPQSVKEAIGRRLNRLTETCVDMLRTAAALGKIFSFTELAAVSTITEETLLDALDEASAAQLIRANIDDTFAFTHDKIREALYEEVNPIRRRRLHQRIGEKLEQLWRANPTGHVRVQDLAYHFAESGDAARALTYSRHAAENATRLLALDEALQYLNRAREAAEVLDDNPSRADIDEAIGDLYSLQGLTLRALDSYTHALDHVFTPSQRGALHVKMGRDYAQVGDARGVPFLEMALTELDPQTQTDQLALATAALGRYHHYHAQHHRALEFLERALALAERSQDVTMLYYLYLYLSGAYQHLMRIQESIAWANKLITLGEQKNFLPAIGAGYEFLGEDAQVQGRWRDALEFARRDREIGERLGAQDRIAWAHYIDANAYFGQGNLAEAEKHARACLASGDMIGDLRVSIMIQGLLAEIQTDRGNYEEARRNGEQAIARSNELKHIVIQAQAYQGLGHVYVRQQQWTPALEMLEQAAHLLAPTDNQLARLRAAPLLAEAYLGAGNLEQAQHVAGESMALAQFSEAPHWEGWTMRVKGQIFTQQELFDEAQHAFDFAIAVLTKTESRFQLAHAYYSRGAMWRLRNETEKADTDEAHARDLLQECGAVLY